MYKCHKTGNIQSPAVPIIIIIWIFAGSSYATLAVYQTLNFVSIFAYIVQNDDAKNHRLSDLLKRAHHIFCFSSTAILCYFQRSTHCAWFNPSNTFEFYRPFNPIWLSLTLTYFSLFLKSPHKSIDIYSNRIHCDSELQHNSRKEKSFLFRNSHKCICELNRFESLFKSSTLSIVASIAITKDEWIRTWTWNFGFWPMTMKISNAFHYWIYYSHSLYSIPWCPQIR